jgi:hypothetical protein
MGVPQAQTQVLAGLLVNLIDCEATGNQFATFVQAVLIGTVSQVSRHVQLAEGETHSLASASETLRVDNNSKAGKSGNGYGEDG